MNASLIGALGEHYAAQYLRHNKYEIKAANFKTYNGEIDLIAKKNGTLCIVEVKTRQQGGLTEPAEAVNVHKQENIKSAASVYLNNWAKNENNVRYDVIEVFIEGKQLIKINHIENAF